MESESENPKRPYHRRPLQCRLCLREYKKSQLEDIFAKASDYKKKIFAAVSVKPHRQDRTTRICEHCRDLVLLINHFRTACQQSDLLLTNEACILQSNTWTTSNDGSVFRQATDLVEKHQQEIDAIFNRNGIIVTVRKDKPIDCEIKSSKAVLPEQVICNSTIAHEPEDLFAEIKEELDENEYDIKVLSDNIDPEQKPTSVSQENTFTVEVRLKDEPSSVESDEESESEPDNIPVKKKRGRKKSDSKLDNNEKVVCPTCGELISKQGLEGHVNRHLNVRPFACDIEGCDAKLHSKFALQQHRSRHKSTNRYYDCEVCGKRIKGAAYWLIHRKIHTEEPRFSCDICGKKFRRKCKLKVHSTVHSGVAEFRCEICGKYFTVKHNLTAHYKLHMKNGTYPAGAEQSDEAK